MNVASLDRFEPIPGYEGLYWINQKGDIKTIIRKGSHGDTRKVLRSNWGYKYVSLTKDGKRRNFMLHRLIAATFIPNPDHKPYINHKDGNKLNNHISNLEWCTSSENNLHAYRTGLKHPNRQSKPMKLTPALVREIRRLGKSPLPQGYLADKFSLHRSTIHRILTYRIWKDTL